MRSITTFSPFLLLLGIAFSCVEPLDVPVANTRESFEPGEFRMAAPQAGLTDDNQVIDGYTERVAYSPGDTIRLFINAKTAIGHATVGLYDITGKVVGHVSGRISDQSISKTKPYRDGFGYRKPLRFILPANLRSGMYLWANSIPFLIRADLKTSPNKTVIVYPSNTDAAYNEAGKQSMYTSDRLQTVSFQQPRLIRRFQLPFLKWAWETNLPVDFICDADLDDYSRIQPYKVIVPIGHSEYWSLKARQHFDRFVDAGNHALILSGNTMWWRITYSADGSKLHCSRDWNIDNWDNPMLSYPIGKSIGAYFTVGGYGFSRPGYTNEKGGSGFTITEPDSPLLAGTGLKKGDILNVPSDEYDGVPLSFADGDPFPIWNENPHNFFQQKLIGYDYAIDVTDNKGKPVYGTFVTFRKTATSGYIINTASTDWCSSRGLGGRDGDKIKRITRNALDLLLNGKSPI